MKFKINSKQLATTLQQQLRVINAKNALAILDNFKLEIWEQDKLSITASDNEITSRVTIDVTSEVGGEICINASKFTDIIRKFGDKEMTFEYHEGTNQATITCGKGKYTLPVIDTNEYPKREMPDNEFFTISTQNIINGFESTRTACSTDTLRPMLTGVHMNIKDESVDFVATDTHRLVRCTIEGKFTSPIAVTIPSKTVSLVLMLFARQSEIEMCITDRSIMFKTEDIALISNLIKGNFPNYERVIPQDYKFNVRVNRKEILDVINRVSGFASSSTNLLVLAQEGMMEMKISATDFDNATSGEDYIMADGWLSNEGFKIGMMSGILTQSLAILSGDEVQMQFVDATRPLKIVENNITEVVMPMSITQ